MLASDMIALVPMLKQLWQAAFEERWISSECHGPLPVCGILGDFLEENTGEDCGDYPPARYAREGRLFACLDKFLGPDGHKFAALWQDEVENEAIKRIIRDRAAG